MGLDFIQAKRQLRRFNDDAPPDRFEEEFRSERRRTSPWRDLIETFIEPPQNRQTLYHYTRQPSFQGIIENRELWLTDLCFFNDRTESAHALEILNSSLLRRRETTKGIQLGLLDSIDKKLTDGKEPARYVTCFSMKGDDLNQWRSYASPGAGYCLGFRLPALRLYARLNAGILARCLYSASEKQFLIDSLFAAHFSLLEGRFPYYGKGEVNEGVPEQIATLFIREFTRLAPLFKHDAFMEEAEVRLVLGEPPQQSDVRFRQGTHALIPYRKLSLVNERTPSTDCMPYVVIAKTSPEPDLMMMGLRKFLENKGYDPSMARLSPIPYRESI